ncbi:hypothetical protein [Streptomyces vinaceus]|uniref:hypothetical protein n=1 Tax=Streptomyces vinaceus TaxID=1960 RepID=UPI00123E4C0D|nr:hypothetical protein [Streptomyces vinaceus]GHE58259.1 hypothetical protein GCM10017778_48210 [Streptomyces vinaceus]
MAHTLLGAGSVGWTMTTANLGAIFRRHSGEEDGAVSPEAARMGKWTFTPASSDRAQGETAALHHEGRKIELNYSSSIFEDFLEAMSSIRHEFNRRSHGTAVPGMCDTDGRSRQESLV